YLDNAATTRTSDLALKAMMPYFTEEYGNPSSLHEAGQIAAESVFNARKTVADCLGALPEEVYFTSGGSESDNQAIISAAKYGAKRGKKHIVSTAIEHHAVLNTLKELEKEGFSITLVGVGNDGIVKTKDIENAINDDTCLVSVMYANNEIGTIQPISEIGKICKEKGVIFHTDAVQAAGHLRIDVKKENIDMLSVSAHKFGGPKGIGALYVKKGAPLFPLILGGAQEKGKRAGTENVPAIVGMAAALKESCENMERAAKKTLFLREELIKGILEIPHSVLNGDRERRLPASASFCFEGIEGESLLLLLSDKGICASSGSACTSGSLDPSHVLLAIGRVHDVAHGSLRLTLSESNTEEEIEYVIKSVKEVVGYLRSISPVWRDLVSGKREFIIK
ncbi:MAG: cysteine desulfurase NifS, partial [Clostridia bacterium]|nr:cysteine desulfurase NifS [Clostridia bacterium]